MDVSHHKGLAIVRRFDFSVIDPCLNGVECIGADVEDDLAEQSAFLRGKSHGSAVGTTYIDIIIVIVTYGGSPLVVFVCITLAAGNIDERSAVTFQTFIRLDGLLSVGLLGADEETFVSESTQRRLVHIVRLSERGVVGIFADRQLQLCGTGIVAIPLPFVGERAAVELVKSVELIFGERPFADGTVAAVAAVDIIEAAVLAFLKYPVVEVIVRANLRPSLVTLKRSVTVGANVAERIHSKGIVQLELAALQLDVSGYIVPRWVCTDTVRHIVCAAGRDDPSAESLRQVILAAGQRDVAVKRRGITDDIIEIICAA